MSRISTKAARLDADPVRARARRRAKQATGAGIAVLALVAGHSTVVLGAGLLGERAWHRDQFVDAERWFTIADAVDVLERWKAPFGRGVAVFSQGEWLQAADLFARAQQSVPPEALCRVVLNRALALETLGDALEQAGDKVTAGVRWNEAQAVLAEAQGCSADGAGDEGESEQEDPEESSSQGEQTAQPSEPEEGGGESQVDEAGGDEAGDGEGESEDSADREGEGDGEGDGEDDGEGQGDSAGAGEGAGESSDVPPSEQEQLESAARRLQQKASGRSDPRPGRSQGSSETERARELAERGSGAARDRMSSQDGAGLLKQSTPTTPTW